MFFSFTKYGRKVKRYIAFSNFANVILITTGKHDLYQLS